MYSYGPWATRTTSIWWVAGCTLALFYNILSDFSCSAKSRIINNKIRAARAIFLSTVNSEYTFQITISYEFNR